MKLRRNSMLIASIILGTILLLQTTTFGTTYSQSFIPDWVKNNADWWAQGLISDREFATGIGFLAKERIIQVENIDLDPQGQIVISDNLEIPAWIKNNARWWADEVISDNDFKFGIQYMLQEKIINFTPVYDPTKTLPSTATSDTMTYNISINPVDTPKIISAVWNGTDDGDAELSNGDTLTITFDKETNQPGSPRILLKRIVDNLFDFENSLGANYTGKWIEPITFRITIDKNEDATHCVGDFVSAKGTMQFVGDFRIPENVFEYPYNDPRTITTNSTDHIFLAEGRGSNFLILNPDGIYAGKSDIEVGAYAITTNSTDHIFVNNKNANPPVASIFNHNGTYSGVDFDIDLDGTGLDENFPHGMTTNSSDHIFATTKDPQVVIFNPDGKYAGIIDTSEFYTPPVGMIQTRGVITNSTNHLFISDGSNNGAVLIFDSHQTFLGILDQNNVKQPRSLATNSTDYLFVADRGLGVTIFNQSGTYVGKLNTTGIGFGNLDGLGTLDGLAINSHDDIFVGDMNPPISFWSTGDVCPNDGNFFCPERVMMFLKGIRNSTSTSYSSTSGIDTTGHFYGVLGPPQSDQFKDKITDHDIKPKLASNSC